MTKRVDVRAVEAAVERAQHLLDRIQENLGRTALRVSSSWEELARSQEAIARTVWLLESASRIAPGIESHPMRQTSVLEASRANQDST